MYLIGYDVGSSSIKASLIEVESGKVVASATSPCDELQIMAPKTGWAEQDPDVWWENIVLATREIIQKVNNAKDNVQAIGIAYQMHGLVVVDKDLKPLRPSIIWCDSRAVQVGDIAADKIGHSTCLDSLLNLPGNFTASKLRWIQKNEPDIYNKIYKIMLPGDYIAMKMTGEPQTTLSGLSEGIFWDFNTNSVSNKIMDAFQLSDELLSDVVPTFSIHGELNKSAADELGLKSGVKISYRAGDQPNNALALNVLRTGEIAANAGTSGVVYGVTDNKCVDQKSRVNIFAHVNYEKQNPLFGVLLCLNGTGSMYRWLKNNIDIQGYEEMNALAEQIPVGSDGLNILPYGNGSERTLCNKDIGAQFNGLQFNKHGQGHLCRASIEGIVFSFNYGLKIMQEMGLEISMVKAGNSNMFLSEIFCEIFAAVTNLSIEIYNTDGSQGAARGAGIGAGIYNYDDAFKGMELVHSIEPDKKMHEQYSEIYIKWNNILNNVLDWE